MDHLTPDFDSIYLRLQASLDQMNFFQVGALFREICREYCDGVRYLLNHKDNMQELQYRDILVHISQRLCQLSRESLFAGDEDMISAECKKAMGDLFSFSYRLIDELVLILDARKEDELKEELEDYRDNIKRRALDNPWNSLQPVGS